MLQDTQRKQLSNTLLKMKAAGDSPEKIKLFATAFNKKY